MAGNDKSLTNNTTPIPPAGATCCWIEQDIIESKKRGQKIITRFPPEPNGFMHIGHAKAFGIDYFFAKRHGGYTNMRFDDTNPEKEDQKYVDAMLHDTKWLGMDWEQITYASDGYEVLYQLACLMIKKGVAYVDDQTAKEISDTRGTFTSVGKASPFRNRTPDENLKLFEQMRAGEFPDGARVLRAKIDMQSPNMNMRDPVMYRIMRTSHYRTGDKWCIYPLYDYAHPLGDVMENVSHSICSHEYIDHNVLYQWYIRNAVLDKNGKVDPVAESAIKTLFPNWDAKAPLPRQFEFGRMSIEQFVMSKRWLKRFVDDGKVDGWDDPRMPTVSGMRRRGYPATAIMDFVESTGVSRTPATVPLSALEYYVRTHLDPVVARASVVFDPIRVVITNYPNAKPEMLEIANNPHDESAGKHTLYFGRELWLDGEDFSENPPPKYKRLTVGGHVRLRGAYIIKCDKVVKDKIGKITHLECSYLPNSKSGNDQSGVKPSGVIHFVEATTAVAATVHEFFPLLKQGIDLAEENLTEVTKVTHNVMAEAWLANAKPGTQFQFVRKGFFIHDGKNVYNKTVSLKEGW